MTDEHIIEAIGKSGILIQDGKVVEVGESLVRECPLAKRFALPVEHITQDSVRKNIEHRIKSFGMCTKERQITSQDTFVGFGATEMLGSAMSAGLIDAAVIAGDGVGTVVVSDPSMIQGIGGRMSGLVKTSPIPEVMTRIELAGGIVLDPITAKLDPLEGVKLAHKRGFNHLAVTICSPDAAEDVRREDPEAIIVAVHTTGTTPEEAERLINSVDLITGCSSRIIREVCGLKALIQAGTSIPVFGMTPRGKEIILERCRVISHPLLVSQEKLPFRGDKEPNPLI